MDEFLTFVGFVVLIAFLFLVFYVHSKQNRELDEIFRRLARRYSGHAIGGGLMTPASFTFHYQGAPVKVEAKRGGEDESDYTQIQIAWPDRSARCEVYPERFSSRLGKLFGMTDVEIGSPEFDEIFVITGDSEAKLRELLSPDVQQAIRALWRMRPLGDIYFSIGGGKMAVKKLSLIREEKLLARFVEAVLHLYDCAATRGSEGIQFVAESNRAEPTTIVCQVCGETIDHELVHCRRCKTPHHEDCWQYFGGCSTFGCGEKRHTQSKV